MNQRDEAKLLEQLEQWNEKDEFSRCIQAIEAIPERERGYLLTVMLRAGPTAIWRYWAITALMARTMK